MVTPGGMHGKAPEPAVITASPLLAALFNRPVTVITSN
jgi:hypothetical protein